MDHLLGKDREAEAAELAGYFAKFSAALTQLEDELARWKNYETDYKALKTTLLDLPNEISHPVMVPIGNLAFMPGNLVHTNEVLVMLGDNWFVDRSALQAAEIVDRRMEFVQENITKLQAQEEQIRSKSGMAPGLLGGQEYNEEGLPIVEITEPYFSDDEEGNPNKPVEKATLPFSNKTPEEQAADRAILDRIAELEREDEDRERRREAGEVVTSDEESESEDDGVPVDYDDGESEDEFRPKALDSDEEYEEEVWEHSGNESDEDEEEEATPRQGAQGSTSGRKSVRFADQVAKAMKTHSKSTTPSVSTPTATTPGMKPKSPSDLINQMRAKQQAVRSSAASDQIVNMANLEATFGGLTTAGGSKGMMKAPIFEEVAKPEPAPLKSALKPPPKKVSVFKQQRAQSGVEAEIPEQDVVEGAQDPQPKKMSKFAMDRAAAATLVSEVPSAAAQGPGSQSVQEVPSKKMSKFAMDRAAAARSTETPSPTSNVIKPAVRGVSEHVFEKNVVASSPPASSKGRVPSTPGVFDVVERNVVASAPVQESVVSSPAAPSSITAVKDVIPNTFTKPSPAATSAFMEIEVPTSGRKKPSLFRRQVQQLPTSYLEPEPAVPGLNIVDLNDEYESPDNHRLSSTVPAVVSAQSVSSASRGVVVERGMDTSKPSSSTSAPPTKRIIPVVASQKLKDTPLMKGAVVENEEYEPVDEDELEDDMLMRQVVSEYQERRQEMIAKYGAFNREDIEKLWEQQVVIPPGMIIPEPDHIQEIEDQYEDAEEDDEEDEYEDEEQEQQPPAVVDDRNLPPKKLSLFRASRLSGTLAKQ